MQLESIQFDKNIDDKNIFLKTLPTWKILNNGRAIFYVIECNNRYKNIYEIKFYSFLSKSHETELRNKWIVAVN